jgi:hypothetical protein
MLRIDAVHHRLDSFTSLSVLGQMRLDCGFLGTHARQVAFLKASLRTLQPNTASLAIGQHTQPGVTNITEAPDDSYSLPIFLLQY